MQFSLADEGKLNQIKFLIDAKWWRQWVDYISQTNGGIYTKPGMITNL